MRTVAAHFKGRVDRYAIWNEPNLSAWLAPSSTSPAQYRSLYKTAYTAIKTVDPKAKVLFGELAPNRDGRTIAPLQVPQGRGAQERQAEGRRPRAAPLPVHEPPKLPPAAPRTRRSASSRG